jgi:cephalosporin hydroxylase
MLDLHPLPSWDSAKTWDTFVKGTFHQDVRMVECQKSQDDLDRYSQLIEETQPDLVIETGTREGGSALWFADQGLQVVTVDLIGGAGQAARRRASDADIHYFGGYSSVNVPQADLVKIHELAKGKRVMVSLDSDHHTPHVINEIYYWLSFVTPGCYLVIEDACFDMWAPDKARVGGARIPEMGGPLVAIQETAEALMSVGFWRDELLEGLTPVSHSPVGWWRNSD